MKRFTLLAAVFLFSFMLFACTPSEDTQVGKTVQFYYCRNEILFDAPEGVIISEPRRSEGYSNSMNFLFDLYFAGPVSDSLRSPFPAGLVAESVTYSENGFYITVSSNFAELRGLDYSLACCCIAKTARALTPAQNVYITFANADNGKRYTVTVAPDNYLLTEPIPSAEKE